MSFTPGSSAAQKTMWLKAMGRGRDTQQVRRRGRAAGRRVETVWAGHARPRGEATQHWHPALPSSQAFLGSSRAERSRGQHVSSARQGGRCSLTAAGKGLALAVSEKEAAKVTDTELSGFSSFSPGPSARQGGRHCSPAAARRMGYHLPSRSSQPFLGPKAMPRDFSRPVEEGKGHVYLCLS